MPFLINQLEVINPIQKLHNQQSININDRISDILKVEPKTTSDIEVRQQFIKFISQQIQNINQQQIDENTESETW